jgi:hypothetical protein
MSRRFLGRPVERNIGIPDGVLRCPRRGLVSASICNGCTFLCRHEGRATSVICSYPLPARDTYARRSRRREDVRIALGHHLERT